MEVVLYNGSSSSSSSSGNVGYVQWQRRDEQKAEVLQKREFIDSERKKTVERLRQYKLVRCCRLCLFDLCHYEQQSGFMRDHSTFDHIVTLNYIAQRRQDYGRPTFAAYIDLRAAFDSLSRPALWSLLTRIGMSKQVELKVHGSELN